MKEICTKCYIQFIYNCVNVQKFKNLPEGLEKKLSV